MDMDSPYIEYLVQDWIEHFQEVVKEQEQLLKSDDDFYMPFVAIPPKIVTAVFKITEHLELAREARYLTIHLYDKFMCKYFWEVYKDEMNKGLTENTWTQTCKKIENHSKLYLASCLQIASKMDSHSKGLGVSQVLDVLGWIDSTHEYVPTLIVHSEFKVFKTVGFKLPTCIPLHCIEVLLAATKLRQMENIYEISTNLLDLVYLQHDQLYSQLQNLLKENSRRPQYNEKSFEAIETNVLFLSAFVVMCSTFFLNLEDDYIMDISSQLGKIVNVGNELILDVANILLIMGIGEDEL